MCGNECACAIDWVGFSATARRPMWWRITEELDETGHPVMRMGRVAMASGMGDRGNLHTQEDARDDERATEPAAMPGESHSPNPHIGML